MEIGKVLGGRDRELDAAWENAVLKTEPPHRKDKEVWEPATVKAGDSAEVPAAAPVDVAAKVAEKAAEGALNKSTIQRINEN